MPDKEFQATEEWFLEYSAFLIEEGKKVAVEDEKGEGYAPATVWSIYAALNANLQLEQGIKLKK